ncbi:G-type lectin S-receptor-like serine/threonine-protein kinase [Cardamine amara subsp. amara]|uniref:Receptor-like serine/threonine-protein kinase n=1 Tax=Cardamine amara subsp. amara TaxID=228776 RepID=A0ABD1B2P0_CARAN
MEICKKNVFFIYLGVLMFFSIQVSNFSSATDTITTDQPLSGTHTIVSNGDIFELGFFNAAPGFYPRNAYYICMLYKQVFSSTLTIVWIANREYPVRGGLFSSHLMISNGNLILQNERNKAIWSTGLNSSSSNDVQAVLLDNGNLELRDGPNSSAAVLWRSFDHPSDTWLPGAKLKLGSPLLTSWKSSTDPSPGQYSLEVDSKTNSLVMVWNGSKSYWSSGPWDDRLKTFKGFPETGTDLSFKLNLNESYITYTVSSTSTYRLVMGFSGQLMQYKREANAQEWSMIESAPKDRCEVYNYCGSFGICNNKSQKDPCRCAPGFNKPLTEEPYLNIFYGGCVRKTYLRCNKENDTFFAIDNIKLDTGSTTAVWTSLVMACANACLDNCVCNAYTYDGGKCFMWTTNAFNLQQLDANQGHTFFLRLAAPNTSTATSNISPAALNISPATSNKAKTKDPKVRRIVLAVVLSSLLAAAVFFVGLYCCISSRIRTKRTQTDEKQQSRELLEGGIIDDDGEQICHLNLRDIIPATNAFSEENKLGEGGFGPVYKGKLPNGMDVAIKRLSKQSSQGLTEFKNEVILIIKLQHKNLVRLLGYCVEGDEKLLIYEYMPNKSLDVLLFDSLKCRELDWDKRMKIINGTTRGLQYLHEDSRHRIIHRDLKASNILLDDEMNPKISDFGTARIFGCKQIDDSTQRIVGTFGYMSPEYALGGVISEKSDIYSFGVLLLEIISGKKATRFVHNDQKYSLVAYAWESWCETEGVSIIDEALCGSYSLKEVMSCVHIALLCVQDHPKDRPTISQIVYMLSNDNNLPIPKQPTFSNVLTGDQQSGSSKLSSFSINEATQTEIEAR